MRYMKKSWKLIGSAVLFISLTGCGANDNAEGNGNNGEQQAQVNQARPRALQKEQGGDRTLRMNDRAEQNVERIKEVKDAHVIISNNDAYVAVRLANNNDSGNNNGQNTGTGTGQAGTMGTRNGGNNNKNTTGNDGEGQSFMENGTVNQNGDNGIIDGKGDAGNGQSRALGNGNNNNRENGTNNTGTNNTGNTNTVGENNNTGTATRINQYTGVSNAFEQKIADQVRKADNKIHRVYVSVNPDFYSTMDTYSKDIRADRNRDNLFMDFNNTITNFFGVNRD